MSDRRLCTRCVLPESAPYITMNEQGLCSVCQAYDSARDNSSNVRMLETDFIKIINKHKGKHKYDCLAMCSGGKDSTAALYFMKKRYNLNPLAFTFDHGFEPDAALDNVRRAAEKLGVDFLHYKCDYMRDMFADMLKSDSKAVICHPCSMWYISLSYDIAQRFDIPLIIAGWTKGQSNKQELVSKCGADQPAPEFQAMAEQTREFIARYSKENPKYKDFPLSMEEVLKRANRKHKALVLSPLWFLPIEKDKYVQIIKDELGWKESKESYPKHSTNCSLNFASVHNSMKHFGYTHYHVEMSKLIREGLMTREEALSELEITFNKEYLNGITEKLDYRFE